jgi:hypothetical protein
LALQEPTWKLWLTYSAHLPLRLSVITEMEQQLYQGFIASGFHEPQLRVELPVGNSPEFRSLLPDLLTAVMPNIIAKSLTIGHLGDLNTLKDRLDEELDKQNSFASFVALIGAFGRK